MRKATTPKGLSALVALLLAGLVLSQSQQTFNLNFNSLNFS